MTQRQRLFRTLILCAIGLTLGAAIGGLNFLMKNEVPAASSAVPLMTEARLGGPFTLTDQDGKTRTEKDFANTYKLIYFGFTYCPAICPTELQKTAEALTELPPETRGKIQPIFITVDPERDTSAILKNYVPLFDKTLIGLTGTPTQIDAVKSAYKVYASKVPQDDSYTMDHSSYIYFMTPDDKPVYMFRTQDSAETIAKTIAAYFADK